MALLIGAALVGGLHMSAPDHWVTLCLLGQSSKWSRRKLFNISLITAVGSALFSAGLGLAIVALGVVFSSLVTFYLFFP